MIKVLFHYYVVVFTIVESCSSGPKEVQSETTSKYRGLEPGIGSGSGGYEKPEPELPTDGSQGGDDYSQVQRVDS